MSCIYAKFNDNCRYDCVISGDGCVYFTPDKNKCIKDGYLDDDAMDEGFHELHKARGNDIE